MERNPYEPPESGPNVLPSTRVSWINPRWSEVILWSVQTLLACAFLVGIAAEHLQRHSLNAFGAAIGIALFLLAIVGLLRQWGPTIPCAFGGMIAAALSTSPIASSPMEGVIKDLVYPAVGCLIGAVVGILWEMKRQKRTPTTTEQD